MKPSNVTHQMSDDGLTLISTARYPDGEKFESEMRWASPDLAVEHLGEAKSLFEKAAESHRLSLREDGDRRRTYVLYRGAEHSVHLSVNTGPPTWWLPRINVFWTGFMVGWIRGLVAVSVVKTSPHRREL